MTAATATRTAPTAVMHCHKCSTETLHRRSDEIKPYHWACDRCGIPWRPFTIRDAVTLAARGRPYLARRVHRAAAILRTNPPARKTPGCDRLWLIDSASRPDVSYLVDQHARTCTCPDYRGYLQALPRAAPHGWCKHRLAVAILAAIEKAGPAANRENLALLRSPLG